MGAVVISGSITPAPNPILSYLPYSFRHHTKNHPHVPHFHSNLAILRSNSSSHKVLWPGDMIRGRTSTHRGASVLARAPTHLPPYRLRPYHRASPLSPPHHEVVCTTKPKVIQQWVPKKPDAIPKHSQAQKQQEDEKGFIVIERSKSKAKMDVGE